MIITGKEGSFIINGDPQPNGIDIQVKNIYYVLNKDVNDKVFDKDYLPMQIFEERTNGGPTKYYWEIWPNQAVLFEIGIVDLTKENTRKPMVGYVLPKSRFSRCGFIIHSALFDFGYKGRGKVLVINHGPRSHKIYKDMYFGQMIFMESKNGNMVYNGSHQGEGLKP